MYNKILWIAAFSISLLLGQSAFARSGECRDRLSTMVESLHLDDAQKAKAKPILEQLKTTMEGSASQMKDLSMQIKQQVQSDTMDQSQLDSLVDKKAKLIGDMMKAKVMAKHQIYMVLNAKQRASYQDMMNKWDAKMAKMFAKCGKK